MSELRWLMRAKRWAQNPPSPKQVKFFLILFAVLFAIAVYEHYYGWPEALTTNHVKRPKF